MRGIAVGIAGRVLGVGGVATGGAIAAGGIVGFTSGEGAEGTAEVTVGERLGVLISTLLFGDFGS